MCSAPCRWPWRWAAHWRCPPRSQSPGHCCCVLARGSGSHPHTPYSSCCVWCWIAKKHVYLWTRTGSMESMDVWQTKPKLCCASNKLMLKWDRCTVGPILWFWAKLHWLQWSQVWVRSSNLSISHLMKTGQPVGTKDENWPAPSLQKLKPNWTFFWGSKKFNYDKAETNTHTHTKSLTM